MTVNKLELTKQAVESIPNGAVIGLGGLSMNSAPMAIVREIIRQKKRDLTVIGIVAGMPVDWLIAGGCVSKIITGLVSFEGFGLAPNFRKAAENRTVQIEEYSEHLLICRLQAQAQNLPFIPTRAGLGSDVLKLHSSTKTVREEVDTLTGEHYVACSRLPLDIAIVHAHEADLLGNVRVLPKLIWMDNEIVNAANSTIASVERIVDHSIFTSNPAETTYPRFMIDKIVHNPLGALPTSLYPDYKHSQDFYTRYCDAATNQKGFEKFFNEFVVEPETWDDFIAINNLSPVDTMVKL